MKLPMPRGLARAVAAFVALACSSTFPALAQDSWLPDAFEPNDVVPTPIGPGFSAGLSLHGTGLSSGPDIDLLQLTIPPLQRVTFDFVVPPIPPGLPPNSSNRLVGRIFEPGEPVPHYGFDTGWNGPGKEPAFDNSTLQPLDVIIRVERDHLQAMGCIDYDVNVSFAPRPCDVLPDDALEGPDDCVSATVLLPGLHTDLVVFNDVRTAGPDADYYRVIVEPGDWFEVELRAPSAFAPRVKLSVFSTPDCVGPLSQGNAKFIQNQSSTTREYFLRVETTAETGYEYYQLDLRSEPCSGLASDALEPNADCGPFAALTPGTHTGLTLTAGDVDGFEVQVPAGFSVEAIAQSSTFRNPLRIQGAMPPACPAPGGTEYYRWTNTGSSTATHRLNVATVGGGCDRYSLTIRVEPSDCSAAELQWNEPNESCATATPIDVPIGPPPLATGRSLRFVLHDGDVDSFRVQVPAQTVFRVRLRHLDYIEGSPSPGIFALAFANGDCSSAPLTSSLPREPDEHPSNVYVTASFYLPNRTTAPLDYVIQLFAQSPILHCESYEVTIVPYELFSASDYEPSDHSTCARAADVRDGAAFYGPVTAGRPLFGAVTLQPGQRVTATFSESANSLYSSATLSLHDGLADCTAAGASLNSTRYTPPVVISDNGEFVLLRTSHTNSTGAAQRVFIELALDPSSAEFISSAFVSVNISPRSPATPYCATNLPARTPVPCPCGNDVDAPHAAGCMNSTGEGARLFATGTDGLVADDLLLHVEGMPAHRPGIVFFASHTGNSGLRGFYDGQLCLGSAPLPVWVVFSASNGTWTAPTTAASTLGVTQADAFTTLQVWYRDASGPCGSGSNTTNAIRIDWQ